MNPGVRPLSAAAAPVLLLLLLGLQAAPARADTLVTSDGRRVHVRGPAAIREGLNLFRLPGGEVLALTGEEIDLEATRAANAAPSAGDRPERTAGVLIAPPRLPEPDLPVSLRLREAPVLDILRLLAELADLNLVVHPEVRGTMTLELRDVPWHQSLEVVLHTAGLAREMRGNVLYVAPAGAIVREAREQQMLQQLR